ncbi:MAG: tail protein X [Laribacter sp.]|nr:tail protein X [Laribacter sp.]MBP9527832.1 tail protein X [Laribacter sp.]MBP9609102.1 tail protein X [Laribacter sp.]
MRVIASQGDTVDLICLRHYGYTAGVTEAVYAANAGLADLGPILPLGTTVTLPAAPGPAPAIRMIQLWD